MFCTKCGAKLDDGDMFCGKCGTAVVIFDEQPQFTEPPQPVPVAFEAEDLPAPPPGVFKPDGEPEGVSEEVPGGVSEEAVLKETLEAPSEEVPEEAAPVQKAAVAPMASPVAQVETAQGPAAPVTAAPASIKKELPAAYCAVNIMEYGDYDWPYVYPGISQDGRIIEEATDHGLGMVMAKTIEVSRLAKGESKYKTVMRVSDIKMEVYVTDARVIYLCDQYNKGGTWTGGLTAIALTAIERGVAKARTRGKTMAGHIRYEWIKHIMYIRKSGLLSNESLRLVYSDRSGNYWQVQVDFDKSVDSSLIANDIMHRAAYLRANLNNDDGTIPESSMQFYREHAQAGALIEHNPDKNTFSYVTFPESFKAPSAEGRNPEWQ